MSLFQIRSYCFWLGVFVTNVSCAFDAGPTERLAIASKHTAHASLPTKYVTYIKNLSLAQRSLVWRDKTLDNRGFIKYNGPLNGLSIIEDTINNVKLTPSSEASRCVLSDYVPLGSFNEMASRKTFVFRSRSGLAMLTRWNLAKDNAIASVIDEFAVSNVNGNRSTVVLSTAKGNHEKAMWQANWFENEIEFELFVETGLVNESTPSLTMIEFLKVADSTRCEAIN